ELRRHGGGMLVDAPRSGERRAEGKLLPLNLGARSALFRVGREAGLVRGAHDVVAGFDEKPVEGAAVHASAPRPVRLKCPASLVRRRLRALLTRDFTVPTRQPRVVAISS